MGSLEKPTARASLAPAGLGAISAPLATVFRSSLWRARFPSAVHLLSLTLSITRY